MSETELQAARKAELDAEAHRNAVVRNGGSVAERAAATDAFEDAARRHDEALAAYRAERIGSWTS